MPRIIHWLQNNIGPLIPNFKVLSSTITRDFSFLSPYVQGTNECLCIYFNREELAKTLEPDRCELKSLYYHFLLNFSEPYFKMGIVRFK